MKTEPQINQPQNILDVIDQPLLESFLRGYNNYTLSGVAIYYLKRNNIPSIPDEEIICINPSSGDLNNRRNYHPFCNYYRNICNQEAKCIQFDKTIVKKYVLEKGRQPLLYCCHMQMWDMSYPIWINNSLYGVIFAGQVLTELQAKSTDWRSAFKEISEYVDYGTITVEDLNTIYPSCIHKLISSTNPIGNSNENNLEKKIANEIIKHSVTLQELIKRFKDFLGFGNLAVELFNTMYHSKKNEFDLQEQNDHSIFENKCMDELAEVRPETLLKWQISLQKVLLKIQSKFIFIERIGIFHNQKGNGEDLNINFDLVAMNSSKWWDSKTLSVSFQQLQEISNITNPIKLPKFLQIAVGESLAIKKNFILYCHISKSTQIYTICLLQVDEGCRVITEKSKKYLSSLLNRIFRLDEVMRLNLREIESHYAFEKHVELTRHDLRTSEQYIIGNIDKYDILLKKGYEPCSPELLNQRSIIDSAITEPTSRIEKLTANVESNLSDKLESINIHDAILKNIELFQATAQIRRINFYYLDHDLDIGVKNAFVVCEYSELNRAIAALIDNAIKYSFDDKYIIINESTHTGDFILEIENYGIGIPDDKMGKIKSIGGRGEVFDYRRHRTGTGMGIYIANQVFGDLLGGKLEFTSIKDPKLKFKSTEEYHNYITTVKVTIPIRMEE